MNYQALIDEIVQELYKKLKQDTKPLESHKKVIVIGDANKTEIEALKKYYQVVAYPGDVSDYESVIISELTLARLTRLAQGLADQPEEAFILKALLEGKKVYMLEDEIEYRKYKKTSYKALYTLYSDYENKIRQYGIKPIGHMTDILTAEEKPIPHEEKEELNPNEEIDFTHKKLLLETDLMRAGIPVYGKVVVGKKSIVTPLAEDFIRTHKLKIKRV